ncbi:type II toxin-antitoxin system YoeB family toxin [Anabaena lutea]|uniref:Endoribonuclease YoeB n=1 Tax=Anabaena lutea FACHB-196 TaxID=2692881 RepID=A0ABR8FKP2_9NOST|nr:type II toxin-antitoxin system YoeB family toxin [Anabaena lutea]MBD2569261.1 type II toxin-antitoxin system YoeB family toxin [Anabaena lutea FACHB-196]
MKKVAFEPEAFEQLGEWGKEDKKVFKKILDLIKDIQREAFSGIGKPEPLKTAFNGSVRCTRRNKIFVSTKYSTVKDDPHKYFHD